jgi:hypothetical protein
LTGFAIDENGCMPAQAHKTRLEIICAESRRFIAEIKNDAPIMQVAGGSAAGRNGTRSAFSGRSIANNAGGRSNSGISNQSHLTQQRAPQTTAPQ